MDPIREKFRDLEQTYIDDFLVPDLLYFAKEKFAFGDADVKTRFAPWYDITYRGKSVKGTYNALHPEIRNFKIETERFRYSKDFGWELFFWGWPFIHEVIHYIDDSVSSNENFLKNRGKYDKDTTEHRVLMTMAFDLMRQYMKEKYTSWYRKNRTLLGNMYYEFIKSLPECKKTKNPLISLD